MFEADVAIGALALDGGETLPAVTQRVTIYPSTPLRAGSNKVRTVLVCHALTGSSRAADWWPGIAGYGSLFDPREWRIICINALGSCYGSTCTRDRITVRDIVRAQARALDQLGIGRLDVVIGGSLGGMQALQWAVDYPDRVAHAIIAGAHDHHSAMGIALNSIQREALALDPQRGLRLARKIAMLTYKSESLFNARHGRKPDRNGRQQFDIEGYLEHQADLFEARMDPIAYATLTHTMDSFDVRGDMTSGESELTFVGITSDWLFRPQDVRAAADRFRARGWNARYLELESDHGHDAFLAESAALAARLARHAGCEVGTAS